MARFNVSSWFARFVADYGMVFVLLLLCIYFSIATLSWQVIEGAAGAELAARETARHAGDSILVVTGEGRQDVDFRQAIDAELARHQRKARLAVNSPRAARLALEKLNAGGEKIDIILATPTASRWAVLEHLKEEFPSVGSPVLVTLQPHLWPNFLNADNLRNIANQISVIAIVAVGMTLVVISGGIDLSVGSLIALSAVVAAMLIRDVAGAQHATSLAMTVWCLAA